MTWSPRWLVVAIIVLLVVVAGIALFTIPIYED